VSNNTNSSFELISCIGKRKNVLFVDFHSCFTSLETFDSFGWFSFLWIGCIEWFLQEFVINEGEFSFSVSWFWTFSLRVSKISGIGTNLTLSVPRQLFLTDMALPKKWVSVIGSHFPCVSVVFNCLCNALSIGIEIWGPWGIIGNFFHENILRNKEMGSKTKSPCHK
jgi:hypothetical protein